MRSKISERGIAAGICVGLLALVWSVFGQAIRFPFINFDDPEYVYEVPEINSGLTLHNIKWAFTHWPSTNWFPLQNISHMVEFQFFRSNPGAFHLTNILLHAIAVLLLFLLLWQMTRSIWRSAFVAAIFAIHPLRVESVVWIIERKDVLSGVFFMLTIGAYSYYTRRPTICRYLAMSILLAAGLLSKPMLVTTPVILLLLDYWPLNRSQRSEVRGQRFAGANSTAGLREREDANRSREADGSVWETERSEQHSWPKLIIEKIPLFVVSAVVAYLTSRGIAPAHSVADQLPLLARISDALISYLVYIGETIWPANLGVFYPYPQNGLPIWQPIVAVVILSGLTITVFAVRKTRPYLLVGWLWYLVMLLPVVGIVQVNLQAHADRYTYLPQIGLCILVAWTVGDFLKTPNAERRTPNTEWNTLKSTLDVRRWALGVCFAAIIAAFAITAHAQVSYWRDSETLWTHTIAVTRDNYFAHASLADLLMRHGRVSEAIEHSEEALRIRPGDANAQNNLGLALLQIGETKRAVTHLEKALAIDPGQMNAEVNLAWILATSPDDSMRNGARAVQLTEDVMNRAGHSNAIVLRTLAAAYAEVGRFNDAIAAAQQAIEIAKTMGNEGLIGDLERSIDVYRSSQPIRSGP